MKTGKNCSVKIKHEATQSCKIYFRNVSNQKNELRPYLLKFMRQKIVTRINNLNFFRTIRFDNSIIIEKGTRNLDVIFICLLVGQNYV